jgi:hypothetical protein
LNVSQFSNKSAVLLFGIGLFLFSAIGVLVAGFSIWASILAVVAILVFIGSLLDPALIFTTVYPFLIIFGQIPIRIFETDVSLERILVVFGSVGIIGGILVTRRLQLHSINSYILIGIFFWFMFYLISTLVFEPVDGQSILISYSMKMILAYVVFLALSKPDQFSSSLKLFLLASLIASIVTFFVYFQEGSLSFIRESTYAVGETLEESLLHGTARAGAGNTMALWISFIFLWNTRGWKQRIGWIVLIFWFGAISLFALRREALITIPIILGLIILYKPIGNRRQAVLISLFLLLVLAMVVVISPEWQDRLLGETVEDLSTGIDTRIVLLTNFTPAAFKDSPWLGYGPGNYIDTEFRYPNSVTTYILENGGVVAHNSWSAALIEAGVIAFIGLCLIQMGIGIPLLKKYSQLTGEMKIIWAFSPLIFTQLLFSMFFGNALQLPVTWFWMGYLAALTRVVQTQAKSSSLCAESLVI